VVFIRSEKENTMSNDIKTIENKFVTNMGSGVGAASALLELVKDTVKTSDGRHIASAIARLVSKGDKQGANAVRAIVGAVMPGAKIGKAKDKKTIVLSLKDAKFDDDAMQRFDDAIGEKLSIRSTLVKRVKGETDKPDLVLPEYAAKLVKRMNDKGVSKAALIAAIQAA
jgi:hypothetical protein